MTDLSGSVLAALGGSALTRTAQSDGLSWIPPHLPERDVLPGSPLAVVKEGHSGEPASASFTSYSAPHPLSLGPGEVDRLLETFRDRVRPGPPKRADSLSIPWVDLPGDYRRRLMDIVVAANTAWWRLEVQALTAELLHYRVDDAHQEHIDMHPGSMQRKLSLSIQLSDSDDYSGGDLELRCWGDLHTMPRQRGTVIAFPAWTSHRVTPVEDGERWALVVWAWGRPVS